MVNGFGMLNFNYPNQNSFSGGNVFVLLLGFSEKS